MPGMRVMGQDVLYRDRNGRYVPVWRGDNKGMNINEFIVELRKRRSIGWCVVSGLIRTKEQRRGKKCCPITACGKDRSASFCVWDVRDEIGLSRRNCLKLVEASDKSEFHDPNLRRRIMISVGLWK